MRLSLKTGPLPPCATFGLPSKPVEVRPADRFYAVAVDEHRRPRIFEYDADDDGREGLLNLIRAEEVVAVFYGQRPQCSVNSVTQIALNGTTFESVLPVSKV